MTTLAVILLLATGFGQDKQPQEPKPIPKGSVEVVTTGCVKGKAFQSWGPREAAGVQRGPDVRGRTFRLNGEKAVMKEVKLNDGHFVEVVGIVRTADLQPAAGKTFGNTRVTLGSPNRTAPTGSSPVAAPSPAENVVIMDVSSVHSLNDTCNVIGH
jgi:hypothetical protein